jgi:hypothetical protein
MLGNKASGLRMPSLKKFSTQSEQAIPMIQERTSSSLLFHFHAGNA